MSQKMQINMKQLCLLQPITRTIWVYTNQQLRWASHAIEVQFAANEMWKERQTEGREPKKDFVSSKTNQNIFYIMYKRKIPGQ